MPAPRTYRAEALVLKNAPFGEADLLVTLFTREAGKVRAVAKGARRATAKLVGHLEPLTVTRLSLSRGRTLDVINQAETLESFALVKANLTAVTKGLQVAELVDGFGSEESPNEPLYGLSLATLAAIGRSPDAELPLLYFQLHLLSVSGLMPELQDCVECRREIEPERHRYSADGGGVFCPDCTPHQSGLRPPFRASPQGSAAAGPQPANGAAHPAPGRQPDTRTADHPHRHRSILAGQGDPHQFLPQPPGSNRKDGHGERVTSDSQVLSERLPGLHFLVVVTTMFKALSVNPEQPLCPA